MTLLKWVAAMLLLVRTLGLITLVTPAMGASSSPDSTPASIQIGAGTIDIHFLGQPGASRQALLDWINKGAVAASAYYGRFPATQINLEIRGGSGHVHSGWEYGGRIIRITVGSATRQADLDDDWMLTHEMIHLGFPDVPERYHWMQEGLATYAEPIARAQAGQLSDERVWGDMIESLPKGQPKAGDRGLDNTHTWGRTYWGGCGYWLLADIEIRKRTNYKKGLRDALRGILAAGGNNGAEWSVERTLSTGDRAVGGSVLTDLHERLGKKSERIDWNALWKQLGVYSRDGKITFDDQAPLAFVRKAITEKPAR